jgi:hypothetical protein
MILRRRDFVFLVIIFVTAISFTYIRAYDIGEHRAFTIMQRMINDQLKADTLTMTRIHFNDTLVYDLSHKSKLIKK